MFSKFILVTVIQKQQKYIKNEILCLRNIYIFRSPITSLYILIQSMQFPVITYGIWHYNINGNMPKNTNIEKIYVHVYASELRKKKCIFTFKNCYFFHSILLVLQKLCRYKWHTCWLTCTDRFPNVPKKLRKSIIGRQ